MARRFATYAALGIGAATSGLGLVTVALSLLGGAVEPRPELITGGIALLLATGLVGNGKKVNKPKRRSAHRRDRG